METLAYLHLALANEEPTDTDYRDLTSSWESLKQLSRGAIHQVWNQPQFSTSAAASLLSLSIALGILGIANQASAAVQEGDQGAEVTAVQQRLQELGYLKASITGYFDPRTKDAVIQFQQAKGLEPDGIVGRNTLVALGGKSKTSSQRVRSRILQPRPSPQSVIESSRRTLRLGDRGSQVSAVQESLEAAGFPSGADGIFDEATQKAVIRFQQAKGLAPDGMVGPQTLAALPAIGGPTPSSARRYSSSRSAPRTTTNRSTIRDITNRAGQRTTSDRSTPRTTSDRSTPRTATSRLNTPSTNASSSATEALQKRLQELGFYRGEIDGIWGPQTQAAVEAAQRSYDVSVSDLDKSRI